MIYVSRIDNRILVLSESQYYLHSETFVCWQDLFRFACGEVTKRSRRLNSKPREMQVYLRERLRSHASVLVRDPI